jgi:two-component system, cell cycle sensor histidine kinase and response regulator CckA
LLADHCSGALERIRAEEALRSSEVRFHSVWENSVDGMRLTDENGIIVAINNAYCTLVGMKREELQGRPFTVVYAESEDLRESLRKYKQRFQRRVVQKLIRRTVTFRSGKVADLEDTNSFLDSRDGRPLLLGLFRDVTQQTRLEEELRQSQKLESIGRLAGGIAHDFNNLLTVISGHASLLLIEPMLPVSLGESVEQISAAADRAANLTKQLLAFGRKQMVQLSHLDLNDIVSNLTKMLQRVLGEDVSLQVSFYSNLPPVLADRTMMEQILLNLAVNSRDAMPKGGQLFISTSSVFIDEATAQTKTGAKAGQHICLKVRDTGCGIPAEHLSKIFEPFFTTKDVGKGTGLGLATVYGIVSQHHGWVNVASEVGRGTSFEIFLPGSSGVAEGPEPVQSLGMAGGSETILIVEDEAEVRNLAVSILSRLGYDCLEARTGVEAIGIWRERRDKIQLVLTDIVMPDGMSGRDLAEELHREKAVVKILFTSGYAKDVVGQGFVLREGINFLQKPYPPQRLAQAIRDCLDSGSIIQEPQG